MKIPIPTIIIGERQRLELGNITEMAESLRTVGQIHNIGITPDNRLIWGRRRLEAAKQLGWTEIEATVREGLTPAMEQLLELEEDIKRKDRTWQEQVLAFAKLYEFKQLAVEDRWTVRDMAAYTGYSKTSVAYILQVAEALRVVPKDEEVWACSAGWSGAAQLLLERTAKTVQQEMERRRQALVTAETVPNNGGADTPSPVHIVDTTPSAPIEVYIHGRPYAYKDAKEGEDFVKDLAYVILAHNPDETIWANACKELRDNGVLVCWYDDTEAMPVGNDLIIMPFPLIWHRIAIPPWDHGPFAPNYSVGYVFSKKPLAKHPNPQQSVITCPQVGTTLPLGVVAFTLNNICAQNLAVVCPCNAPVVEVAETGRVPIWYEPDPAAFAAKVEALKAFYETTIPNVVVKI